MKFEYQIIQIKKNNGDFVFIKPVPITRLIEFSWKLQSVLNILEQLNLSFISAYEIKELEDIRKLCSEAFSLSNLDIKEFNLEQINELIFEPGILQEINKLKPTEETIKPKKKQTESTGLHEFVSRSVTLLVHLELALDLKEAWSIADSFPADQLESFINARILQVDPDYEKRASSEKDKADLMDDLIDDLKSDSKPHKFIFG